MTLPWLSTKQRSQYEEREIWSSVVRFCRYFILWATGRATDPIFPGHGMLPVAATTMNKKKKIKIKIEKRQDKAKKRVTHMGWWGIKKCNRAMKKQKEKYRSIVRIFDPIFLLENIG